MSRLARAGACVLLALASCQSGRIGTERWHDTGSVQPGDDAPRTRVEVLHTFGIPQTVSDEGPVLVYRYVRGRSKGLSVGVQSNGLGLSLTCTQSAFDMLEIRMAADGRVLSFDGYVVTDALHYRLWPF